MRYVVTGSAEWNDWGPIATFVGMLRPGDQVAHGAATTGLDKMLHWMLVDPRSSQHRARKVYVYGEDGTIGQRREGKRGGDVDVNMFPADWERHRQPGTPNEAGKIRDRWMLGHWRPDVVVYFASNLGASPRTSHLVGLAREYGIQRVYSIDEFIEAQRADEAEEDE